MPTEKDVDAHRGMAKNGPMVRYSAQVKNMPYFLPTRLLICISPSLRLMPMEATPSSGMPTPVIKNPTIAGHTLAPAFWPISAGKIRLPAPKNSPNSMLPTAMVSEKLNRFFIPFSPPFVNSPVPFIALKYSTLCANMQIKFAFCPH